MRFYPQGGMYSPIGGEVRNQPVEIPPANPLPENKLEADTGNAGLDGYSVKARASRFTDRRQLIGGFPEYSGPREEEN